MEGDGIDGTLQGSMHQVIPAYEQVKLNVIFHWFKIQSEMQNYIFIKQAGKAYRIEKITSLLLAVYMTMLKSMMVKRKKDELIAELDAYVQTTFVIPEDKLIHVITEFEVFLYEIGYLNTLYERKPWQDDFKESYGVFE